MELSERDDVPQTLIVGTLCFLQDIELSCIASNLIEAVCIHQDSIRPRPFRTLSAEGMEDESELTQAVSYSQVMLMKRKKRKCAYGAQTF